MASNRKKVFIILGPTSSGKTSLALDMCSKFDGEIISADSRQVIKYMDIGTGKVPVGSAVEIEKGNGEWSVGGVKVYGYDLVEPDEFFSGYDFAVYSLKKAREIINNGKNVFIVGGTGFYIDLLTGDIKPSNVMPDEELRVELEPLSVEELQQRLSEVNKEALEKIDIKNKFRLIRAIEKAVSNKTNGKVLPYLDDVEYVYLGLTAPRDYLYARADRWVEEVWDNGLIEEVRGLVGRGYENSAKMHGLVYKTSLDFINNKILKDKAVERIKYDIHAYIRRQQTWFKRNKKILWVDVSKDDFREIIYNIIEGNLNG